MKKSAIFLTFVYLCFTIGCSGMSLTPTEGTDKSPYNKVKEFLSLLSGKTLTVENGDVAQWLIKDDGKKIERVYGTSEVYEFDSLKDNDTAYYKIKLSAKDVIYGYLSADKKYYDYSVFSVQDSKLIWYNKGDSNSYTERKEKFITDNFNTNAAGNITGIKSGVNHDTLDCSPYFKTKKDIDVSVKETIGSLN